MSRTYRKNWTNRSKAEYLYNRMGRFSSPLYKANSEDYHSKVWDEATRDGRMNETGCNKAFKRMSKATVRNASRRQLKKVLKDPEAAEDMVWPRDLDGKQHICDVW